uniref:GNAT family N-acetyltransferase n=1 Tax=Microbacterium sp. TaxID=51671 RepID=UPI002811FB1D
ATHHFLSADDRDAIESALVTEYLPHVRVTVAEIDGRPVGFAGTAEGRLEMLFVHDAVRGRGIGSALLANAIEEQSVTALDVNEQNPEAVAFYIRKGFTVAGRSPRDDAGRPYPILHLTLAGE